jgi:hypothetical protein
MLPKDLRAFIELLNSNGVEYVIVGGYALTFTEPRNFRNKANPAPTT